MIFNLFSLTDLPTGKIIGKTYYIVTFHLSSCVVYAENFKNIFSIHKQYIRFTGQSVLVNGKLTLERGNRVKFSVYICFGVGARKTRLSDNMTLG